MISVSGLLKSYGETSEAAAAVRDVEFEAQQGEIVTLLGPSGCGKTTTLRCIAGLERPSKGRVMVGGRSVVDCAARVFVPPHKRNLGMVFQSYAIWPHMTVFQNVAYALEGKKVSSDEARRKVKEALEIVQMSHLAERPAPRLSGGQQQRVAIARALAGSPQALLFDEPLSNLDAKLRAEMRKELRRLQRRTGLTSIYVTHDQAEALAISDWIVVMKDGQIIERGRPMDVYRRPKTVFAATFLGATNLIEGALESRHGGSDRVTVATPAGPLKGVEPTRSLPVGALVYASFRPEDAVAAPSGAPAPEDDNRVEGALEFAAFGGAATEAEVSCAGITLNCRIGRDLEPVLGTRISLRFPAEACLVLGKD